MLLNCSGLKGSVKRSEIHSTLSYTIRISHWGVSRLLADIPTYSIFFLCFNIYYIVPQHEIVPLFNCRTMVLASFVAFDLVSRPHFSGLGNQLPAIANKFGLTQHLKTPTRHVSRRSLDLSFSTNSSLIHVLHIVLGISDHDPILFGLRPASKVYEFSLSINKGNFKGFPTHQLSFSDYQLASSPRRRPVKENRPNTSTFTSSKMTKSKRHLPWIVKQSKINGQA